MSTMIEYLFVIVLLTPIIIAALALVELLFNRRE
jgi:hypothetical protein